MIIPEFLKTIRQAGIRIHLGTDDTLVCDAPTGVMTEELQKQIRQNKSAIIDFLKQAQANKWSSVVMLQPGGSRYPFFCFHEVGGNVLHYSVLLRYLSTDQPFYGVQSRGLDGITPPFQKVEDMARHYVEEIKTIQPKGPYYLGGGSMGGNIAFEVAQQLKANGEIIGLLILFDSFGPNVQIKNGKKKTRFGHVFGQLHGLAVKRRLSFLAAKLYNRYEFYSKLRRCKEHLRRKEPLPHDLRFWFIERQNYRAMKQHTYKPYDDEIILFRSEMEEEGSRSDPNRGWKGIASNLTIWPVSGKHENLIEQPELGQYLNQVLQNVQTDDT